jgi:phosphoglycolate phosphatase-like HAD superfamily hydrolase
VSFKIPATSQLVLDFDGVLCDSALECLHIIVRALAGAPVSAFLDPIDDDVAVRYWRTRPFMSHMGHFLVPLLGGLAPADREAFAARFAEIPKAQVESFAAAARAYRELVRGERREDWLALHEVWSQVSRLVGRAYIATARDRVSVLEILSAHGVQADPGRIYDELGEKTAALADISRRESVAPADVFLLDDAIQNCLAAQAAGFGTGWASWGCGDPGDESIAIAHDIPVIALDDLAATPVGA